MNHMQTPLNQESVVHLNRVIPLITLANNGITPILNTTLDDNQALSSTAIGPRRGQCAQLWLVLPYFLNTLQDVTLTFQHLVNGAWVSMEPSEVPIGYVGGANTMKASATARPGLAFQIYGDVNVFVTNGGTGPGALQFGVPYLTNVPPGVW